MIRKIQLQGMLPKVFVSEKIPDSDVWRTELIFERGRRYRIEAASGAGKSSLCSYIYGARDDYEGKLLFDGADVRGFSISAWQGMRRESLAYLPQELSLFPELTAWENIMIKNSLTGYAPESRINGWIERLGIDFRRDYPARMLSIGQQQRVAIVRSLCQPFDFILLDEPVSHLDAENNRIAAELICEEAERQGAAVISTSVGNPLLIPDAITIKL